MQQAGWNADEDVQRIYILLNNPSISLGGGPALSPIGFVSKYCFDAWQQRNRHLSITEMAEQLEITIEPFAIRFLNFDDLLKYLEFAANLVMLCDKRLPMHGYNSKYTMLKQNIAQLLDHINFEQKCFSAEEKIILVEKNAAVTAVAELFDEDTSRRVIEYNHYLMRGDIERKREILSALANKWEPIRESINSQLADDIGFMLNNFNIRHNNQLGKHKKEHVVNMPNEELEDWYDETYQMLLLSFLENDNIARIDKVKALKNKVKGNKT